MNQISDLRPSRYSWKGGIRRAPGIFRRAGFPVAGLLLLSLLNMPLYTTPRELPEPSSQVRLEDVLERAENYCQRLKAIALHFVCLENITEIIFHPFRSRGIPVRRPNVTREENKYVYDYQLIQENKIEERRRLIGGGGQENGAGQTGLATKRFRFGYAVFGPTGLFGREAQTQYEYSLVREGRLWDRPVVVVRVVPKTREDSDRLYGQAWIDKEEGSILKVEWEGTSLGNYMALEQVAEVLSAEPKITLVSEYRFVKNGIRFPSLYSIKEDYNRKSYPTASSRLIEKSRVYVEYTDYKFFIVETEVKH